MITAILILMWAGMGWLAAVWFINGILSFGSENKDGYMWMNAVAPLIIALALVFHILITRYLA